MEQITAFRCEYCSKTYSNKHSCKRHERKCYKNPETRSCSCCAFLNNDNFLHPDGTYVGFKGCLLNYNISSCLRTGCKSHKDESFKENLSIMSLAIREYKHYDAVHNYLKERPQLRNEMSKAFI